MSTPPYKDAPQQECVSTQTDQIHEDLFNSLSDVSEYAHEYVSEVDMSDSESTLSCSVTDAINKKKITAPYESTSESTHTPSPTLYTESPAHSSARNFRTECMDLMRYEAGDMDRFDSYFLQYNSYERVKLGNQSQNCSREQEYNEYCGGSLNAAYGGPDGGFIEVVQSFPQWEIAKYDPGQEICTNEYPKVEKIGSVNDSSNDDWKSAGCRAIQYGSKEFYDFDTVSMNSSLVKYEYRYDNGVFDNVSNHAAVDYFKIEEWMSDSSLLDDKENNEIKHEEFTNMKRKFEDSSLFNARLNSQNNFRRYNNEPRIQRYLSPDDMLESLYAMNENRKRVRFAGNEKALIKVKPRMNPAITKQIPLYTDNSVVDNNFVQMNDYNSFYKYDTEVYEKSPIALFQEDKAKEDNSKKISRCNN